MKLRRRFLHGGLRIPALSQPDLAHPHERRTSIPINTLMDYMTSSKEFFKQITAGVDLTDAGKAAKEISAKASNWITSQVWDPIKKYGTIALGIVLSLIALAVCWKIYRCACQTGGQQPADAGNPGNGIVVIPMPARNTAPLLERTTSL